MKVLLLLFKIIFCSDQSRLGAGLLKAAMFSVCLQSERWSCTRMRHSRTASTLWTISWWCTTRQTTRTMAGRRGGTLTGEQAELWTKPEGRSNYTCGVNVLLILQSLSLYLFLSLFVFPSERMPSRKGPHRCDTYNLWECVCVCKHIWVYQSLTGNTHTHWCTELSVASL